MKVYFSDRQLEHDPQMFLSAGVQKPSPEKPERATRLLESALAAGLTKAAPEDFGLGPIARVHTPEYLSFLSTIHTRWQDIPGAGPEVIPNVHPDRRSDAYPTAPVGQAGFHQADTACPIGPKTWDSAYWGANSATAAASAVASGSNGWAYALCRPPGHHAFADMAGGFCFLNNCGIAAAELLSKGAERVAVVDVDLHHGNGTQGMFYNRNDVLTVSIHADPVGFYPFFWGHADERGQGPGLGYNYNLPLAQGTGDDGYMPVLDQALDRVSAFAPDAIVVALGLDGFEGDPFGGLRISTEGFGRISARLAALNKPTVLVQEGGYLCDDLGRNLESFLDGFGNG